MSKVPAVAYLRKSTKGDREGKQKQEKSLGQQRDEVIKLARDGYLVKSWFEDEGVSGWKRGAKRPDFQRMIDECKALGAKAVLCDHIDRFTRATYDDVLEDTRELRKAGVRWIVTASHGPFDLEAGQRGDIGGIISFAAAVWAAHGYSSNLGRRITLARRNAAKEGKRTGGRPPYAMADDGKGGLRAGDSKEVEVVRLLFTRFAYELWSINRLTGDLNAREVPSPRGGKGWTDLLVAPLQVNAALMELGAEVRLWWKPRTVETSSGNTRTLYDLARGRFKVGTLEGSLPRNLLKPTASRTTPAASATCGGRPRRRCGPTVRCSSSARRTGSRE